MEVLNRSTVTLAGAVGPHAAPANPTIDCFRGSTDDFMVIGAWGHWMISRLTVLNCATFTMPVMKIWPNESVVNVLK